MIDPGDLDLLTVTDSPDDAIDAIRRGSEKLPRPGPRRHRVLLER
jgi:hypothetical protein